MNKNLIYHIYPDANLNMLAFHMVYLRTFINVFDNKYIKVTTDNEPVARQILDPFFRCIPNLEIIYYKNNPTLGENVGFMEALEKIYLNSPKGLTFVGSTNGVSKADPEERENVKAWSKALYFLNLTNVPLVEEILSTKIYHCFGAMKRTEWMHKGGHRPAPWHYSGLFYWMKNSTLFSRNWKEIGICRHGIEMYPGYHFTQNEAYCIFNTPANLYHTRLNESEWYQYI